MSALRDSVRVQGQPFGRLLNIARRRAGKTLRDVAEAAGVTISYVHDVEVGRRLPFDATRTIRAAECLGADPREMLHASAAERGCIEVPSDSPERVDATISVLLGSGREPERGDS